MKSLSHIKTLYAQEKHFKSWEHFCSVANDAMFIRAIDDVAQLFANAQMGSIAPVISKMPPKTISSKRNKHSRKAYKLRF